MRGIEYVKALLIDRLSDASPAVIDRIVAQLDIDQDDELAHLPAFASVLPGEPREAAAGDHPVVFVQGRDTVGARQLDIADDGAMAFLFTYRVRLWLYATGQDSTDTLLRRDRLTLALRWTILDDLTLGTGPGDGSATVKPDTFRESFSSVSALDGEAESIAASWLEVDITVQEHGMPASLAAYDSAQLNVRHIDEPSPVPLA